MPPRKHRLIETEWPNFSPEPLAAPPVLPEEFAAPTGPASRPDGGRSGRMSSMNRRTFLGSAVVGVGTLGLPSARAQASASRRGNSAQPTSTGADVVVVGAGAFGGWTALYLREMGVNVTMVDAYGAGNARASSGGETRQIRAGYASQEYYTRWVVEAFARWKRRQAEWGRTLFSRPARSHWPRSGRRTSRRRKRSSTASASRPTS